MDPTPAPTAPDANPLAAALGDALGGTSPNQNSAPDFLASTMALLDGGGEPDAGADPTAGEGTAVDNPAEPSSDNADPADPLAAIDDAYPDLDGKASPEAQARWGELKSELKAERASLRAIKREIEELKGKSLYDPAEVDTLKKQVEEYNRELAVHRIEATVEYQTAIDEPLRAIGESAASIARRYSIDQDTLFDALADTDESSQQKALQDLVDGMNDRDRLKIYQMADDTLLVLRKRDDMKAHSHEALQELELRQKQTSERTRAEQKREFTSQVDRVFDALEDKLPFHPLGANETKSAVLEKLKADTLASDLSAAGADVQAYSAAAGVLVPRLIQQMRAVAAENKTLKDRLSGASAASPARARSIPQVPGAQSSSGGFLENIFSQLPT